MYNPVMKLTPNDQLDKLSIIDWFHIIVNCPFDLIAFPYRYAKWRIQRWKEGREIMRVLNTYQRGSEETINTLPARSVKTRPAPQFLKRQR
jgi:hypothetical protein